MCMWQGQSLCVGVVKQLGQHIVLRLPLHLHHHHLYLRLRLSDHLLLSTSLIPNPHPLSVDSGLASSPIVTWPRVYMRSGHKVTPTNALYSLQKVPSGIWEYGWDDWRTPGKRWLKLNF